MSISAVQSWHDPLNERESQILSLISEGQSNREIARELSLSLNTIKWYNKQIYSKLGVSSRTQAVAAAREYGLLDTQPSLPIGEQALPKHNLPQIPTTFIGRQHEMAEVRRLLQTSRLVVLTGAGGSGKTRLALQVAAEIVGNFPDGVWLVELAQLSDPELVPNAIADTLGVSQRGETSLVVKIKNLLRPKRLLLVLDNFEHLLDASSLVGELIASAPHVTILATSREKLHVYGEQEFPVQPLALPNLGRAISNEQVMRCESASLFVDRARAVKPGFKLLSGDAAALARMCVHLDGLPLALELAASRVKMFSLSTLEERLSDRLSLLTGGASNLPERQRTLRDTIEWSFDLLESGERLLFFRLSVFRGGGTLEAVERICGQDLPHDLLPLLSSLVDKSLVRAREGVDGEMRFGMLETIREYALEQLNSEGESASCNLLHAEYYASMAEIAAGKLRGHNQGYWFARVQSEYDNLRAALTWSLNSAEIEPGMRITAALRDYWYYSGFHSEYKYWTDLALERMPGTPPALQAGVLVSAGLLGVMKKDSQREKDFFHQAVRLYSQLGDEGNAAWSKMFLSGLLSNEPANHQKAVSLCQESLETFRRIGDLTGQAQALNILGEYSRVRLELGASKQYYEECLELVVKTGERLREGMLYGNLGFIAYRQGDYLKALQLMQDFSQIMEELGNDYLLVTAIASMSGPLAALGQPERAARLLAAAEAQLEEIGGIHQFTDTVEIDEYRRKIRELLGEGAFRIACDEGSHMTVQQMMAIAHEEAP